jgi:hypothetical protein
MYFMTLHNKCGGDWNKYVDAQIALGLDALADLPGGLSAVHPDVKISEWKEYSTDARYPVLHKLYETPAGAIKAEVRQTADWKGGDHIHLGSDFTVPSSRSIKQHVSRRADLKCLRYLLAPPDAGQIGAFRESSALRRAAAKSKGLILSSPMEAGSVVDAAIQIAGVEPLIYAAIEDPDYLEEFFSIMWDRSMLRMEITLDEKPDLYIRRGWYENMSFWSPEMFRRFMKPYLAKEARWAREAGAKFAYINTCSYMPIVEDIIEAGVDVLIGVDPVEDKKLNMAELKDKARGRLCLWGGGNGFVTVENGTPEQIRGEVLAAIETLAPGGGFILAPIDNITEDSDRAMDNAGIFVDAWKKNREFFH